MIAIQLFDPDDRVTYSLSFTKKDAKVILTIPTNQTINIPSIEGNILLRGSKAAIMYRNGATGMGSIYTDYNALCSQLTEGLIQYNEE